MMVNRAYLLLLQSICLFATAGIAQGVTINFESVPGVTPLGGFLNFTPVPPASRLNTQLLSTYGVRFRSESPNPDYIALINLGAGHATSGTRGIGPVDTTNGLLYTVPVLISFFDPANTSVPAVTDFVSIRADLFDENLPILMQAFDLDGNLIGTDIEPDTLGPLLSISTPGIHTIRLYDVGGTVAYDDLTFNELTLPLTPGSLIPEPSGLMMWGMALSCLSLRRNRRN